MRMSFIKYAEARYEEEQLIKEQARMLEMAPVRETYHREKASIISANVTKLRKFFRLSQTELAKKAGVTRAYISQIEKGIRVPGFKVIFDLSEIFDVDPEDIIGRKKPITPEKEKKFYKEFGDLDTLSDQDQEMIRYLIKRLKR